jgi:hypothetical protein
MKKIILSMIGLMAATAFAPQASAVPAFARQTGMGCNSCHTQHFPVLSSFGRAFKADGFTMVGSQAMLEEEHLSLPATLNAGILLKAKYVKTNGENKVMNDGTTTNDGRWVVPDEFGLFFGGRLADTGTLKVGTMIEHSMDDIVGFRIPVVTDMGGVKLSAIPFLTDALGPFYGYTESSTGLNRAVRWNEHHADISAHRYIGLATDAASGVTLLAKADMGYVALTQWAPAFPMNDQSLSLNLIHAGLTMDIAGFDTVITGEMVSGTSKTADATPGVNAFVDGQKYESMGVSAQAHGELAGMSAGFYATYASAPKTDAADLAANAGTGNSNVNAYNDSVNSKRAFTVGGEVSVIPHALTVGAAYRDGRADGQSDNALTLMMNYDIAQNMGIQITHSMYSGDKYDNLSADSKGDALTSFLLETAW